MTANTTTTTGYLVNQDLKFYGGIAEAGFLHPDDGAVFKAAIEKVKLRRNRRAALLALREIIDQDHRCRTSELAELIVEALDRFEVAYPRCANEKSSRVPTEFESHLVTLRNNKGPACRSKLYEELARLLT